jgi:hypothetical protein
VLMTKDGDPAGLVGDGPASDLSLTS